MRILFLPHNGKPYGANKSLLSAMVYLSKKHEILLFSPFDNKFSGILNENNIRNNTMPYYSSLFYVRTNNPKYFLLPLLALLDLLMFPYLLYKIIRFNPDLIYSNSSVENLGILFAKILKKKHITHVREFGDLDYDFKFLFGRANKQRYLNLSDGIIFNSKIIEQTVLPKPVQATKTKVIYNGIKIATTNYENLRHSKNAHITFGLVGHLQEKKGQLEAISFIKKHIIANRNIKLKIFGDGVTNYIGQIKKFIIDNKMENQIELMGFVSDTEEIYKSLDILLLFSRNEAFGRVTIEAMQKGIPVIAYNGGGTKELIRHDIDGLLFNSEQEFDKCIDDILNDQSLYENLSKNAVERVSSLFSEDKYCENIEDFINEVFSF